MIFELNELKESMNNPINVAETFSIEDEHLEEIKKIWAPKEKTCKCRNRRQKHKKMVKIQMEGKKRFREYSEYRVANKTKCRIRTIERVRAKQSKAEVKNFMQLLYQDPIDHIEITAVVQ